MLHQGTSDFTVAAAWSLLEAAAAEAAELLRKREYGDWSLEAAAGEL